MSTTRTFDMQTDRARFVDAVTEGMADALAGRVHSHAEVKRRMRDRLRGKAK